MAQPVADLKGFCQMLIASRLYSDVEVRDLWSKASARVAGAEGFAAWLVETGKLTKYQADSLLRGNKTFLLDDYKLLERIGQGRMAGVYRAQHKLGMPVAIKILPPSRAKDTNCLARFQREAGLALKMDHPRIVKTYHAGTGAGLHYIAMELLDGETLDERLGRKNKLPIVETLRLVQQILEGLNHLQERNVVHRDLKPSNLMLQTLAGQNPDEGFYAIKLLDIGLGRELFDDDGPVSGTDLTAAGTTVGTPNYMSPEQCRNSHGADIRSDLYSLGCVMYEAITGRVPFPDKNIVQKLTKHATEMPPVPDYGNFAFAAPLHALLWRLLAKKPCDRPQTPAEALREVSSLLQSVTAPAVARPVLPTPAAPLPQIILEPLPSKSPVKPPRSPVPTEEPSAVEADPSAIPQQVVAWILGGVCGLVFLAGLLILGIYLLK